MESLLDVNNLSISFTKKNEITNAVDDINFFVKKKEIMALVGESGSGKSVTALSILGLLNNSKNTNVFGKIIFKGENLLNKEKIKSKKLSSDKISMIFQDPIQSLNPVFSIGYQISEVFMLNKKMKKKEAWAKSIDLLEKVGIANPSKAVKQYPHQFSGGMCQRVMIALALAKKPELLIADEPTTSLDVTTQYQILKLLDDIHKKFDMSILFITHDLGIVAQFCHRVGVILDGEIVEEGSVEDIFRNPLHPYTKALINSIPIIGNKKRLESIPTNFNGESFYNGCKFYSRCSRKIEKCKFEKPRLENYNTDHFIRCFNKGV